MAGTKTGGRAAASTNKTKYGADFYAKIGAIGGKKGRKRSKWTERVGVVFNELGERLTGEWAF